MRSALELPVAWSTFIETNMGGTSCLGPQAAHLRELKSHARRTALEPWHAGVLAAVPTPV
jgi:hypothetical protein